MTLLIAAVLLVCQSPPSDPHQTAVAEVAFVGAVEDFVRIACPTARPPELIRSYFARMGSPEWRERDRATREAEAYFAANPGEARWLFWGRRSRDPEVATRCNAALRRLSPCLTCGGSGQSKNYELYPCWDCSGFGTVWPWSIWD
jgi:hypothetical protein